MSICQCVQVLAAPGFGKDYHNLPQSAADVAFNTPAAAAALNVKVTPHATLQQQQMVSPRPVAPPAAGAPPPGVAPLTCVTPMMAMTPAAAGAGALVSPRNKHLLDSRGSFTAPPKIIRTAAGAVAAGAGDYYQHGEYRVLFYRSELFLTSPIAPLHVLHLTDCSPSYL